MNEQAGFDFDNSPYKDGKPGYKRHGSSENAAKKTETVAASRRKAVHLLVVAAGAYGVTPEEAQKALGLKYVTQVRPRFTELSQPTKKRDALIREAGTRPNDEGNPVTVWVAI